MRRLALFGGVLLLGACGGKGIDDDDDDDDGTGGGLLDGYGDGADDTGFEASPDAPRILTADVSCDYTEC